jgi:hypothetical protein
MSATEADVLEIRAKLEKIIAGTKEVFSASFFLYTIEQI